MRKERTPRYEEITIDGDELDILADGDSLWIKFQSNIPMNWIRELELASVAGASATPLTDFMKKVIVEWRGLEAEDGTQLPIDDEGFGIFDITELRLIMSKMASIMSVPKSKTNGTLP